MLPTNEYGKVVHDVVNKIKAHPAFASKQTEKGVVRKVNADQVKKHLGVDLAHLHKQHGYPGDKGWIKRHGQSNLYSLGQSRASRPEGMAEQVERPITGLSADASRERSLRASRELDAAARSKQAKKTLDAAAAAKQRGMMKEQYAAISDAITLVANHQYSDATGIINDILSAQVSDALQNRKEVIAQSLFAPSADSLAEGKTGK